MNYAVTLALLGCVLIGLGVVEQGYLLPMIWLGGDFLILGLAHASGAHNIFGKRASGALPAWSRIFFLPLLICNHIVWHLSRLLVSEPALNAVTEDLSVGRRQLSREVKNEFENYVDLTSEFTEPAAARRLPGYLLFPILDAAAPTPNALLLAVRRLRPGKTFIHCAQGHGRTGLFALAVLLDSKRVRNVEEGFMLMQRVRPRICLNARQRKCIEEFAALMRE